MPTDFNFDTMSSTLRNTLGQHQVQNVEEIVEKYRQQLTATWRAQNIQPEEFNEIFKQGQSRSAQSRTQ